jgi:phosphoribosylformylglycinamidine (FGAM) synthase PurS component
MKEAKNEICQVCGKNNVVANVRTSITRKCYDKKIKHIRMKLKIDLDSGENDIKFLCKKCLINSFIKSL